MTIAYAQGSCRNLLLLSMEPSDFTLLQPRLSRVTIEVDEVLAVPGKPIDAVYFPEAGIITQSELMDDGSRIGIGHVGYEGMAGWPVLVGSLVATREERMTAVGGAAFRTSATDFRAACEASETLRDLMLRFVAAYTVQLSRTVVSSLTQSVETRLARWTIMVHDRVDGDEIEVTHQEIAVMLAVRRSSVTDALHVLEGENLIRCQRGRVQVRDREGLIRRASSSYGAAEAEYSRLIAPFPRLAGDRETSRTGPTGSTRAAGGVSGA